MPNFVWFIYSIQIPGRSANETKWNLANEECIRLLTKEKTEKFFYCYSKKFKWNCNVDIKKEETVTDDFHITSYRTSGRYYFRNDIISLGLKNNNT